MQDKQIKEVTNFDHEIARINEEIQYWQKQGNKEHVTHYENIREMYEGFKANGQKVFRVI
jgi:hypothetical protein